MLASPSFSHQAKVSELSLAFWLTENVDFAFVFSSWHSPSKLGLCSFGVPKTLASPSFSRQAKASELSLVFWLNENVRIALPDGRRVLSDSYDADMSRSVY